jgi:ATP-dependent DNA helicase RecG
VAFANALGGRLLIGIEDEASEPPTGQRLPANLPDTLRRRLGELTVNVSVRPSVHIAPNGAAFIELTIDRCRFGRLHIGWTLFPAHWRHQQARAGR